MKLQKLIKLFFLTTSLVGLSSCEKENVLNSAINVIEVEEKKDSSQIIVTKAVPWSIDKKGSIFMQKMQGHWVGINRVMNQDFSWFAFDYRPISKGFIHGIFEGGTTGNLLTSFFSANYKGTNTLMARNGGVLNGIYRSSYFFLDSVSQEEDFFRFVDALGGRSVMSMEMKFVKDSLYFNAYTSRLGLSVPAIRHMTFKAKKQFSSLAEKAVREVGFDINSIEYNFENGFDEKHFYINDGRDKPNSATYLDPTNDPIKREEYPYLGYIDLEISQSFNPSQSPILVFLSKDPLILEGGSYTSDSKAYDSILLYPVLTKNKFTFTYVHPGDSYLTVVLDRDQNGAFGLNDRATQSQKIQLKPKGYLFLKIDDIPHTLGALQ